ncbi:RidA family protein [Dysosmobacter welbionis]|uniref:RidA family protein n=1 Tax=Dysosmobacter welbionis TaxID=2093857 RepID=UPI00307BEFE8
MSVYENLKEHGIELPKQLAAAGLYKPVNRTGNLVFISGQGSMVNDTKITGRVGADLSVEEGAAAARICAINTLSALEAYLGDLNKVKRCVKILGFVASADDFHGQAQVINGASQVFMDAFGEEGRHARSAIGSNALPLGLAVEVESIFEIEEA